MTPRQIKTGFFVLEGLNAFATTYFFNYLFFYMQARHQFSGAQNLWLGALNGFVYIFGSWQSGKFAQKYGYRLVLRLGFSLMILALLFAWWREDLLIQLGAVVVWTLGVCCTWPVLEASVSEGESPAGVQQMVGIYNLVWAGASALAYFMGGWLLKTIGMASLFLLPIGIHLVQGVILTWLPRQAHHQPNLAPAPHATHPTPAIHQTVRANREKAAVFLRMAWVANPFAYIAINTVVAVIPSLAQRLHLSMAMAGVFCSIWYFARLVTFVMLWQWPRWHYRFSWLMGSYLSLVASFLVMLLVPNLWAIVAAQLVFGFATGLTYYSSLFYSMDAGDTKGEHGGLHEAAIGIGLFLGPAIAAVTTGILPHLPQSGPWAVGSILAMGSAVIGWIRYRHLPRKPGDGCDRAISEKSKNSLRFRRD